MQNLKYAFLAALVLGFTACQKEGLETDDDATAALSATESQEQAEDINAEAELRLAPGQSSSGCPTVTFASPEGTFPNTITIDFGTGCTGINGRTKSGQIIVEVSADRFEEGSVRSVTPVNFYADGFHVEGSHTVTNLGLNESNEMQWEAILNHTITSPEGKVVTRTANHVRTLVEGLETPEDCSDDVVEVTGSASGVTPRGDNFTAQITSPLVKRMDCRWPVSGVEVMTIEANSKSRTIDFGSGECDDQATVTCGNGETRVISIRRPRG